MLMPSSLPENFGIFGDGGVVIATGGVTNGVCGEELGRDELALGLPREDCFEELGVLCLAWVSA